MISAPTPIAEDAAAARERPRLPAGLADRAGFLLAKAHLAARQVADPTLAPLGLDVKQYGTLMVLASEGPLSQQTVGELLPCDRTTMVALVDSLEAKAYVERRRNPSDRRAYALHITPAGRRALARAKKLMASAESELLAPLSAAEVRQLKRLLQRLLTP